MEKLRRFPRKMVTDDDLRGRHAMSVAELMLRPGFYMRFLSLPRMLPPLVPIAVS